MGLLRKLKVNQGLKIKGDNLSISVIVREISGTRYHKEALLEIRIYKGSKNQKRIYIGSKDLYLKSSDDFVPIGGKGEVKIAVCPVSRNQRIVKINFHAPREQYVFERIAYA